MASLKGGLSKYLFLHGFPRGLPDAKLGLPHGYTSILSRTPRIRPTQPRPNIFKCHFDCSRRIARGLEISTWRKVKSSTARPRLPSVFPLSRSRDETRSDFLEKKPVIFGPLPLNQEHTPFLRKRPLHEIAQKMPQKKWRIFRHLTRAKSRTVQKIVNILLESNSESCLVTPECIDEIVLLLPREYSSSGSTPKSFLPASRRLDVAYPSPCRNHNCYQNHMATGKRSIHSHFSVRFG